MRLLATTWVHIWSPWSSFCFEKVTPLDEVTGLVFQNALDHLGRVGWCFLRRERAKSSWVLEKTLDVRSRGFRSHGAKAEGLGKPTENANCQTVAHGIHMDRRPFFDAVYEASASSCEKPPWERILWALRLAEKDGVGFSERNFWRSLGRLIVSPCLWLVYKASWSFTKGLYICTTGQKESPGDRSHFSFHQWGFSILDPWPYCTCFKFRSRSVFHY